MKGYELASEQVLPRRLPVVVRLDGNSFSKFTKRLKLEKPFDERFERAMESAARAVLEYCSGGQLGYIQSDEITILLRNDQTHQTDPFLGNRTQKLASLLASTASVAFNEKMREYDFVTPAIFDCRAFVVPPAEVNNVFLWRQKDAFKNFVSSYAYFKLKDKYGRKTAQKMLHGLSTNERQELIFQQLDININDLPVEHRRGRTVVRVTREVYLEDLMPPTVYLERIEKGHIKRGDTTFRSTWEVDRDIPLFNQEPDYIQKFLATETRTEAE